MDATNNEPFQMEFSGNPKRQIHVKGVMVSCERLCLCSTSECHEDRRLDFQIPQPVEITAVREEEFRRGKRRSPRPSNGLNDDGSLPESGDHLFVDDHVDVTIAISCLHIGESMILLWKGKESLCEHGPRLQIDGNLSFISLLDSASDPNDIT
jgi:hypothetical protein